MPENSAGAPVPQPAPTLDFDRLRYPGEPSRFAMAVICVICAVAVLVIFLAAVDVPSLVFGGIGLVLLLVVLWVALQFARLRLLGDAVLVSRETFPEVQKAVDQVRELLQYTRRVDIFVVPNLSPRIQLTSYFGIRALLIEGGAVADITGPAGRPQLLFLLGTYFGAFKAKHDRWIVAELVLDNAGIRSILAPFVAPWLRSTVYTGDQIAYACSGDFQASLDAVIRVLVGRELSAQLAASGLILQAGRVSRSPVIRSAELLRPVPHTTNRFLNLLRFAEQVDPDSVRAFRAGLSDEVNAVLDEALARIARQGRSKAGVIAVTTGVIGVTTLLLSFGLPAAFSGSPEAVVTSPVATPPETPTETPVPTDTLEPSADESLIAAVPTTLADSCVQSDPSVPELSAGLLGAVRCSGTTDSGADYLYIYSYEPAAFNSAVEYWLGALENTSCASGGRNGWHVGSGPDRGVLGCYESRAGMTTAVWTYDADAVLVVASDAAMSLDDMYAWWQQAVPTLTFP